MTEYATASAGVDKEVGEESEMRSKCNFFNLTKKREPFKKNKHDHGRSSNIKSLLVSRTFLAVLRLVRKEQ